MLSISATRCPTSGQRPFLGIIVTVPDFTTQPLNLGIVRYRICPIECSETRRCAMRALLQDLQYGARMLANSPGSERMRC